MTNSNPNDIYVVFLLACPGFLSVGYIWGCWQEAFWRIEWIKVEHDLARLQKRQPRKIKDVEKGVWKP